MSASIYALRLGPSSTSRPLTPETLPPGRFRLTNPTLAPATKAIGIVSSFLPLVPPFVSSLDWSFDLDQLLCTRPGQVVVGGSSSWLRRPAALLQVITLFPVRRN